MSELTKFFNIMRTLISLALLFILYTAKAQNSEPYFLSSPSLTPDGQTVVFSFEGDIWKASVKDGFASRLTAMQGYENGAKVSPDGKWIAFTGRQFNNSDVYVMPVEGGEVKQLTFHSGWTRSAAGAGTANTSTSPAAGPDKFPDLKWASKEALPQGSSVTTFSKTIII